MTDLNDPELPETVVVALRRPGSLQPLADDERSRVEERMWAAFDDVDGTVDADAVQTRLESACDGSLARFKHPKHYDFVDGLPRNAMAKVQKNDLRERYRSALA